MSEQGLRELLGPAASADVRQVVRHHASPPFHSIRTYSGSK
ncbi:hypothetical protein ACFPM0_18925 [Pseudonocardia sulfidoxydans]